jgi:hypothetical protein
MLSKTGSFTSRNSALPVNAGTMPQVELGNKVALNVGGGGVGAGRTIHKTGTQQQHGSATGPAPVEGRSIFGQFPPEVSDKSPLVRK